MASNAIFSFALKQTHTLPDLRCECPINAIGRSMPLYPAKHRNPARNIRGG